MMALRMAVLGYILAAIGGCASDGRGGGDGGTGTTCELLGGPGGTTVGGVDYQVLGGFTGQGDGTSLQITSDGSVTRHTRERGTEHGQLDQPTIDDLVGKARAAEFPTLCATYTCSGCNDDYVHDVSVRFDGIPYTVQASFFASPPARLAAVIEALQKIASRPLL